MGDDAAFPLTGVKVVSANGHSCTNSDGNCCWKGNTTETGSCNTSNGGYSGCNRTVCSQRAASIVCANLKYDDRIWRLPTKAELASFASYSINKGVSGLMLCDKKSNYGSAWCEAHTNSCGSDPVEGTNDCHAYYIWSSTAKGNAGYYYGYYLFKGSYYETNLKYNYYAESVRCVSELDN